MPSATYNILHGNDDRGYRRLSADSWYAIDDTTLLVNYAVNSAPGIAGRFQISVPVGATITDARIRLYPVPGTTSGPFNISVFSGSRNALTDANYTSPSDFYDYTVGNYNESSAQNWASINGYIQHGQGSGSGALLESIQWYIDLGGYAPGDYLGFLIYASNTDPANMQFYAYEYGSNWMQLYVEWAAGGVDILQAFPGKPVWIYSAKSSNLYERREVDGDDVSILAEAAANPSAWIQPGGRRYVAFDRGGDCQFIYYDGTWSSPVNIRADRTDPAAIPLPESRDVMIVCKDSSDNFYMNMLRWNGTSYDVETEINVGVTGNQTGDGWVQAGGMVYLAYTDTGDDLQAISTDLSGAAWS